MRQNGIENFKLQYNPELNPQTANRFLENLIYHDNAP